MPERSKVALAQVASYDADAIAGAMHACLEPFGGMSQFVKPGQRVLLKPNLLGPFPPERAVTTHPAVLEAAIALVQAAGGQAVVGDSPGFGTLRSAAAKAGLLAVIEATGAELADFDTPCEFECAENTVGRRLTLAKAVRDADVIITLPKLKTHVQMILTAAVKNQYGLIPGMLKGQWHFRLQDRRWLARLLLDINRIARPALAIVDAVTAMEGEGPSSGTPRQIGALLAGPDLVAVDVVACRLIGLDPAAVPAITAAREAGMPGTAMDTIEVVGDDWQTVAVADFANVTELLDVLRILPLPRAWLERVRSHWTARPRIDGGRCVECGICRRGCPVSPPAIDPERAPRDRVDDRSCIRCYCCHEFCPEKAIFLQRSWLNRLFAGCGLLNRINAAGGGLGAMFGRRRTGRGQAAGPEHPPC